MKKLSTILVNATALRTGGALTILRQFVEFVSSSSHNYVIFVYPNISLPHQDNCEFIQIDKTSWFRRVLWDSFGVNRWINNCQREVSIVISLQNTSIRTNLKQIVYLHQALPYHQYSWNILKKNEIKLFLYTKFYKFFINAFMKDKDVIIVQSNWLKKIIENEHGNLIVKVFRPSVEKLLPEYDLLAHNVPAILDTKFLFYPSSFFSYKNHLFLLDVIDKVRIEKFSLVVTFKKGENNEFDNRVIALGLEEKIYYSGYLSKTEIVMFYDKSHAVIFPSEIETFGLPLLEAAGIGKKLICADLAYAHDVIDGYHGVEFVESKNITKWRDALLACLKNERMSFSEFTQNSESWSDFFNYIDGKNYV